MRSAFRQPDKGRREARSLAGFDFLERQRARSDPLARLQFVHRHFAEPIEFNVTPGNGGGRIEYVTVFPEQMYVDRVIQRPGDVARIEEIAGDDVEGSGPGSFESVAQFELGIWNST